MSRCKACNTIITGPIAKRPDGHPESMCRTCISLSYDTSVEHEYEHSTITTDEIYILTGKDYMMESSD